MKKRVFLPLTISHILVIMIPGSMLIACIIGLVLTYIDTSGDVNSGDYIIFYSAMIFLLYSTIRLVLAPKISLKKEFIYKNGDGLTKIDKIQYKCKVYYKDINKIEIISSSTNSNGQQVNNIAIIKFLEFTLKNGKKERMLINYYRKKQIIKMLNIIKNNMQVAGNDAKIDVDEIMKAWYTIGGYNKKNVIQK